MPSARRVVAEQRAAAPAPHGSWPVPLAPEGGLSTSPAQIPDTNEASQGLAIGSCSAAPHWPQEVFLDLLLLKPRAPILRDVPAGLEDES